MPNGVATTAVFDEHGGAELVDPAHHPAAGRSPGVTAAGGAVGGRVGDPVSQHHVEHETEAVGEREREPERLADEPDVGQRRDPADRQRQRQQVAAGPGASRGQDDGAEKLDRADRGQRQPVHRQVEQRVHRRQHDAEPEQHPPLGRAEPGDHPPRAPPHRKDHGRARDPQPGDPEHADVDEQQHRQRRAEIVKDRAHQEERGGRQPRHRPAGALSRGR